MSGHRFYDRDQSVCEAVNVTRQLPRDFQGVLAKGISQIAIRDHQADHRLSQLKSLGAERILPLYKSKNKRRDYDQVPEFHTAMSYLQVLSEDERRKLAEKVIELAEFAREYVEKCKYTALLPDQSKMENIQENYLRLETAKARQYLEATRQAFLSGLLRDKGQTTDKNGYIADGSTIHLGEF